MRQMKPFLSWLVIFAVFVLLMPLISEDGEDDSDRTECNIAGKGVNEISWYLPQYSSNELSH